MGDDREFASGPTIRTRFWNAYGRNPPVLYVKVDGVQIGHWDIQAGVAVPGDEEHPHVAEQLVTIESAGLAWLVQQERKRERKTRGAARLDAPVSEPALAAPDPPEPKPSRAPTSVISPQMSATDRGRDLSLNKAGASAREMARAKFREAPLKNLFDRLTGRRGSEAWRWRQGVRGEEEVGRALDRAILGSKGWLLLHGVTRHARGTDIDHLLIGPGGIFSINAKFHEGKKVWVSEHAIGVGRTATNHLHAARSEAKKVKQLLDAAYPTPREVTPMVVVAGSASFSRSKKSPADVVVLPVSEIGGWLASLGEKIRPWEVEKIYGVARWERTWLRP